MNFTEYGQEFAALGSRHPLLFALIVAGLVLFALANSPVNWKAKILAALALKATKKVKEVVEDFALEPVGSLVANKVVSHETENYNNLLRHFREQFLDAEYESERANALVAINALKDRIKPVMDGGKAAS